MVNIFESKFKSAIQERYSVLNEDDTDALIDDLDNISDDDVDIDMSDDDANLINDIDEINKDADTSKSSGAGLSDEEKNEDQILKDRISQRIENANEQIIDWSNKIESVMRFLNDPTMTNSMKSFLDTATDNSPIDKVKKACGTRITRIASEMAALVQELRAQVGGTTVKDMLKDA